MTLLTWILKAPILAYRLTLSPFVGRNCRYLPTCSEYALESLDRHGPWTGTWLILRRLGRCQPWGGHGYDPVPDATRRPAATHTHSAGSCGATPNHH